MIFFKRPNIPLNVQFEAACAAASVHDYKRVTQMLSEYGYPKWASDHHNRLKKYLTFTPDQLLEYLRQHHELCEKLWGDCADKRVSASTVFQKNMRTLEYEVGFFDVSRKPDYHREFRSFETIEEAATDYVLFSLGMPRLNES